MSEKEKSPYPFGRVWVGVILFAIIWLLAYKFAHIVFI